MNSYQRTVIKTPRLRGLALKGFVAALESPAGGVILDKVLADAGFLRFREMSAGTWPPLPPHLPHPSPLPSTKLPHDLAADAVAASDRPGETVKAFADAYAGGVSPVDVADRIRRSPELNAGLSVRATDEVCIVLKHPLIDGQERTMLPEILRSSFCGRFTGRHDDSSSDAGVVWSIIDSALEP